MKMSTERTERTSSWSATAATGRRSGRRRVFVLHLRGQLAHFRPVRGDPALAGGEQPAAPARAEPRRASGAAGTG